VVHADYSFLAGGEGGAELDVLGPVSRGVARRLACDAKIMVSADGPLGQSLNLGRTRRDPSDAQRIEIRRRDKGCRFPGCTHTEFTDVHHVVHWVDNGPTDLCNLVELCAAYNIGALKVSNWMAVREGKGDDALLFIESMHAQETRLYVKRVLTYHWMYRRRLGLDQITLGEAAAGDWPIYRPPHQTAPPPPPAPEPGDEDEGGPGVDRLSEEGCLDEGFCGGHQGQDPRIRTWKRKIRFCLCFSSLPRSRARRARNAPSPMSSSVT